MSVVSDVRACDVSSSLRLLLNPLVLWQLGSSSNSRRQAIQRSRYSAREAVVERQDCIMAHVYIIIWWLPISSFNGQFKPLWVAWSQHSARTNQLHNLNNLNDPTAMLEPTSDNALAWCRVHKICHGCEECAVNTQKRHVSHICNRKRRDKGTFWVQQPSGVHAV